MLLLVMVVVFVVKVFACASRGHGVVGSTKWHGAGLVRVVSCLTLRLDIVACVDRVEGSVAP